jgi:hypothetical protein
MSKGLGAILSTGDSLSARSAAAADCSWSGAGSAPRFYRTTASQEAALGEEAVAGEGVAAGKYFAADAEFLLRLLRRAKKSSCWAKAPRLAKAPCRLASRCHRQRLAQSLWLVPIRGPQDGFCQMG